MFCYILLYFIDCVGIDANVICLCILINRNCDCFAISDKFSHVNLFRKAVPMAERAQRKCFLINNIFGMPALRMRIGQCFSFSYQMQSRCVTAFTKLSILSVYLQQIIDF